MANWVQSFLNENPEYASMPIFKRSSHGIHFQQGSDIIGQFTSNPCHYLDRSDGLYKPLDTNFLVNGNLYYNPGFPHITITNGNIVSIGTGYSQITRRVGVLNTSTMTLSNVFILPTGTLNGDRITKETSTYKHELIMKERGIREEFTLYQNLGINGTNEWLVLETEVTGITFSDGWLDEDFIAENYTFPVPRAFDAQGRRVPIRRYAKTVNGKQIIYTGIRAINLNIYKYPIVLDPDFTVSGGDGYIYGESIAGVSTARSTYSGYYNDQPELQVGYRSEYINQVWNPKYESFTDGDTNYIIDRSFLSFGTSSIGAGSTVTQVNLYLKATFLSSNGNGAGTQILIAKTNWGTMGDATYDAFLTDSLDDNIWRDIGTGSGTSVNTYYGSGNLSTSWINKTTDTKYGLIMGCDRNNNFSIIGRLTCGSSEHTSSNVRPYLTVAYTSGDESDYGRVMMSMYERT